jgi:type IV pilus assembly protein PilQ
MRLKQLLGVLVVLLMIVSVAAAAGPQLTNVSAAAKGNATTVMVKATGPFTHNEYRPADNLLLVDLTGVSAGKLQEAERNVNLPGVKSYRVLTYKGANGAEVTRLEIALNDAKDVNVTETKSGLQVVVSSTSVTASAPEPTPAKPAPRVEKAAATAASPEPEKSVDAPGNISKVSVVRGSSGMEVHIQGATSAKVMKIESPARIVLDFANTVPAVKSKNILVNSPELKSVRIARFEANPPVTRVVLDLKADRDYQMVPGDNSLTVKLASPAVATSSVPAPVVEKPVPAVMASAAPAPSQNETPQAHVEPASYARPVALSPAVVPATKPESKPAVVAQNEASASVFVEADKKPEVPVNPPAVAPASASDPTVRAAAAAATVARAKKDESDPMPPTSAAMGPKPAVNLALEQQQQQQTAARPAGPRYTGEPISVNLKDVDLKDFFRLIHDISGLNVVLDPNVKGSLTLVLDDVPWDQALDIVLQNNGLDRQLQGNVLRIATTETIRKEAEARRAQAEAEALAVNKETVTRFLSYAHAKDVMPTIKKFLTPRGDVIADDRTNALIISDIPSVIPEVDRLIAQLDRKTQEVEIEARVVAATRSFARDIGTQLGFGVGNSVTAVGGGTGQNSGLIANGPQTPQYFVNNGTIPLFSNLGVQSPTSGIAFSNATNNYRIDAILTMAESKGLVKILSRPRVVTQNNITAVMKQGYRIPVVTAAQLNGPPTVTYVDALLRLTVTPQITVENTIFLAVDVENTTPDKSQAVQGNPALLTQQATTQVLVTDGGTVVIGGVIQTQNSVTVNQVPLLGDLPVLGNLFKRRSVSTQTQELIFFITPKIVQT